MSQKASAKDVKMLNQLADAQQKLNEYTGNMADTYMKIAQSQKSITTAADQSKKLAQDEAKILAEIATMRDAEGKFIKGLKKDKLFALEIDKTILAMAKARNTTIQKTKKSFALLNDQAKGLVDSATEFIGKFPGGSHLSKLIGLDRLAGEMEDGLNKAADAYLTTFLDTGSATKGITAASKQLNMVLLKNPMMLIAAAAIGLIAAFKSISKEAQKVSADTGLTYTQSKLLVKEANKQVAAFGNQLSTQSDIIAVQKEQIAQLGVIGKLSGEQAGAVSDIGKAFGYGAAQAGKVNAAFMTMGASADQAANAQRDLAAEALKAGVNVATITKDIADNAASTAKFFGGNVKALKKAALEAAKMGVSLKTMVSVSEGLLKFEDSISNQFEFQALTGKQINLDKARQLALEGDIAGATKLVLDQAGSISEFNEMNYLQRQALAKATGMEVDELQKSLIIKDRLGDLTADELASMNALGLSAAEMENMSAKDLQNKLAQQQSSEKTAAAFAAMKAQLVNALMPAGQALMSVFAALSPLLKVIGVGLKIAFMPLTLAGKAMEGIVNFAKEFAGITTAIGIGTGLILANKKKTLIYQTAIKSASAIEQGIANAKLFIQQGINKEKIKESILSGKQIVKDMAGGAVVLAKAVARIFSSFSAIPFGIGIPLAIAAAGGLFAMFKKATAVGDLGIDPNGGPIVSSPTVGGIFQGDKRDGLSMGPGMGTNPSTGGAGVVNNYYGESESNGVTMQQVIDALSNITINMDGKALAAEIRVSDSFRRG